MSVGNASAAVRFPDGTVKFTIYHGTSDVMHPTLFDTLDEAWGHKHGEWVDPEGTLEDVEIYSDYGKGFWWYGQAARNAIASEFLEPFGDHYGLSRLETTDGTPDWFTNAIDGRAAP